MKSKPASKGTAEAALQAAERAFSTPSSLPLDQDLVSFASATEGRQRLTGAFLIEISRIRPDPEQPRRQFDTESQRQLSISIERHGILQPITVRYLESEATYQIISGERRFHAAKALGLATIPCWIRTPQREDVLIHQIVENWQRVDLHPFDLADTLAQLRDNLGYTQKQIAELTGKPESEISKLLSLLKLRGAIQQQYRREKTGSLSRRHLENIAKLPVEEQVAFHEQVQEQKITATETEKLVQERLIPKNSTPRRGAPTATRKKIVTPKGTVVMIFRRKQIEVADALQLLDLAKHQLEEHGL